MADRKSKAPEVTDWFPGDVKPVRVGVYERDYGNAIARCRWSGKTWFAGSYESWGQSLPWRGLASNPALAKKKAISA